MISEDKLDFAKFSEALLETPSVEDLFRKEVETKREDIPSDVVFVSLVRSMINSTVNNDDDEIESVPEGVIYFRRVMVCDLNTLLWKAKPKKLVGKVIFV